RRSSSVSPHHLLFSFFVLRPPPLSTLFPYTTLFRSKLIHRSQYTQGSASAVPRAAVLTAAQTCRRRVRPVYRARTTTISPRFQRGSTSRPAATESLSICACVPTHHEPANAAGSASTASALSTHPST